MTINKTGIAISIIFGLSIISFAFLTPIQAKSQKPTETEEITETLTPEKENIENKEDNRGQVNAESHRSAVATFVQNLLKAADREGGIGEEVRVIAQQQNDSKEKSVEAIDKIEKRSKLKTFLIGNDYKNLGALRSEIVKNRNSIKQLKRLVEKARNKDNITELNVQIQNLETEQERLENFIKDNEDQFSLFGWVAKLLNK